MYNTPANQSEPRQAAIHSSDEPLPTSTRQLDSRLLLNGAQEVRIAHYGQEYRLRQMRSGKLILTK